MLKRLHQKYYDFIAIIASVICAIHCAALPILATLSAGSNMFGEHSHGFDNIILLIAVLFAYKSLYGTFKKTGNATYLLIALFGFSMILIGRFLPFGMEIFCSVIGGLSIAMAHFLHLKFDLDGRKVEQG